MRFCHRVALILVLVFSGPIFTRVAGDEPRYPESIGYVSDFARVISSDYENRLTEFIAEVEKRTGVEIAVVTVETAQPQPIDMYAVELFTRWGVGKKEKDDGVLIVLAMEERKVWIEVGYGLEGVLPDGFCGEVYRQLLVPSFRQGEFGKGLYSATTAIGRRIGEEYGVEISGAESAPKISSRPRSRLLSAVGTIIFLAFVLLVFGSRMGLFGLLLFGATRRRGFWTSGTFGGSGGFSGGFGGFGGGSCGGGGAGGGW